jgi:hypothetical protein
MAWCEANRVDYVFGLARVVLPHAILLPAASRRMLPVVALATVFLSSVERSFSVPAMACRAVVRRLGQPWPQATAGGGA